MRILVLRTLSQNNVLTRMAERLFAALDLPDVERDMLSIESLDRAACAALLAERLARFAPDHVVSFASFTADFAAEIYLRFGCGFVGWDVDHPAYQFDRFVSRLPSRLQICASRSHLDFQRRIGCGGVSALTPPGVAALADDPVPIARRPIRTLVAMSWIGEPEVWWARFKGKGAYDLVDGMVERLLADDAVDLLGAFDAVTRDRGMAIPIDKNVANLVANVGLFIRRHDRLRLAQALAASGRACVIQGEGWRHRLGDAPHLTFAPTVDFDACGGVYGQARTVINLNAANGASERAITAMAAGAVVASDFSPLLADEFGAGRGIAFWRRADPASVVETLAALDDDDTAQAMADTARARVAEAHLWRSKARMLVDVLRGQRLVA